ncbi:MAG: response regulator [Bdellovibrionales bacterium]|nr:response regulator [Bdellovibrionales bacterium]
MPAQIDEKVDILLVDDREDGLIALEAVLGENPGYRLVKATSGRAALSLLDKYDFGLILLDVQMPELDGFETAELIRRQPNYAQVPIVFVTAINKDERYVYRGFEAGAVDYVFKPFDPVILSKKVAVFAELHLKNRRLQLQSRLLAEREAMERKAQIQSVEMENLRRYRNLADAIPHIVLRALPDGDLEYHNHLWTEYTGLSLSESLGMGWQSAICPDQLQSVLSVWYRAMRKRTRYETECKIRRYDGVFRWHWVKAEPELNDRGEVMAWLGTCTDIHDRKTFEDELKEAQQKAESANHAKTQFLANMSHEIRTPLNAIMGFTELLLDPHISDEEKNKSVSIVRRNGHALMKIVDEILDISKVEAGGLELEEVELPLFDMLNEVKTLMNVQAAKKNVTLAFEIGSRVPTLVKTDSTRVRQILLNLIGNAIKFTREGRVALITSFSSRVDEVSHLHFLIQDSGVGIDRIAAERIFQPFSQADTSTTRLFGGTGLGLALARKLARALGGDVRLLNSSPGQGSTFEVTIAVEVPPHTEWIEHSQPEQPTPQQVTDPNRAESLKGKRILLVEDAEDNQFLIKQFLSRTGAILDTASNGREGISKALANDYEVVLMEIQMPLVDGYQATTELRQKGYDKPIIALTAHALNEERERCMQTGCSGHLTKPISRRQLIDSLLEHVSH